MPIGKSSRGVQLRASRKDGWTLARRRIFLDELAMTCNVRWSARAAGMKTTSPYLLRRRDPEFARLWEEALAHGAKMLEEQLLAHAIGTPTGDNPECERPDVPSRPFDPELALKVLKFQAALSQRTGRKTTRPTYATTDEVRLLLIQRLDALAIALPPSSEESRP